jgi:hypothetical protein
MFGLLTFCLNFIPTVGLLVAVLLPLPVVILAPTCDQDAIDDLIALSPAWTADVVASDVHMDLAGDCYPVLPNPASYDSLVNFQEQSQHTCNGDQCFCCGRTPVDIHGQCCGTKMRYAFGMALRDKILCFIVPYLIQIAVANFIEPYMLGKRLNLHPVAVLFALVFWYMMWGVAGAFLSVPIMSVLKILALNMDNATAQWFARLLEGQTEKATRESDAEYPRNFDYGSVRSSESMRGSMATSSYDFDAEAALGQPDEGGFTAYQMSARIEPRMDRHLTAAMTRSSDFSAGGGGGGGGGGVPGSPGAQRQSPRGSTTGRGSMAGGATAGGGAEAGAVSAAETDGFTLGGGSGGSSAVGVGRTSSAAGAAQLNPARRSRSGSSV